MTTASDRSIATLLQVSTFGQYFFPFGNIIFPIVIWSLKRKESKFIDIIGKQAINFQLSLLLYFFILIIIEVPLIFFNVTESINLSITDNCEWIAEKFTAGNITSLIVVIVIATLLFAAMKVLEFCLVIYAATKNSNGETYNYPLTINFIK